VRTSWYHWVDCDGWFELKIVGGKYKGNKSQVILYRYNTFEKETFHRLMDFIEQSKAIQP